MKAGEIYTARNFLDGGEMLKCEHTAEYACIAHNADRPPPQKESLLPIVITMAFTPPQSQTLCKLMLHSMFRGRQQYSRTKRDSGENKMSEVEAW